MSKRLTAWFLALALLLGPGSGLAQQAGLSGSVPEGVARKTLANGLRIVVVPDRLAPVVATSLSYLVGSNDAPEGFPGTAHALEHMMFRGSEGLDQAQMAELGALLGGVYNATTTETVTQYTYTVPASDLGLALRSEALRMRGALITEADWAQERGAIEQEVSRNLSSPFYAFFQQVQAILFQGSPYENDALGTRPSFDRTTAAMLREFYDRWYAPNNAILVIAGAVDPQAALAEAEAVFGPIPRRDLPEHRPISLSPVAARAIELPTSFPLGIATLAYRMPGLKSADFAAADVLGDVLGSQRGALYAMVPAGQALLAEFSYQPKPDVGYGLALAAFPQGEDPAPLLAEMRRILGAMARDGVPAELVETAKRQELAQLAFENDSISGLARTWSRALASRGVDSPEDLARAYAAVTVEDVNRLARTLLDPEHALTVVLTPRAGSGPVTSGGFGGAESFGGAPDRPVTLPTWAAAAVAGLSLPETPEPPVVSTLPNGLRLIVQPERVSRTVSVYGRVRSVAAMQEAPGKEGVASLTSSLFNYGTQDRDRLAFRKAVDDLAAQLTAGSSFSLKVLSPQFEAGMRLLAENQLRPAFPEAAFATTRGQLVQTLAGTLRSPEYLFNRSVQRAVVPEADPTLREATPETVRALQLADVRAYYAAAFRPDLTTIVVLGDVTPDEARRVVEQTFGGWAAEGPVPVIDPVAVGPSPVSYARVPDAGAVQDLVALTASVTLPVTSPDRYTLELGNVILAGGFSSRLYRDLRSNSGYVYSVSGLFDWDRTRASYAVQFGADPENVEKARQLVLQNIRQMQTTPVSEAELARAKAQVLRRLPMQRASIPGIAAQYLRLADLGLPLNSQEIAARRYLSITAPELQQAFANWLRPDEMAQVIRGPAVP